MGGRAMPGSGKQNEPWVMLILIPRAAWPSLPSGLVLRPRRLRGPGGSGDESGCVRKKGPEPRLPGMCEKYFFCFVHSSTSRKTEKSFKSLMVPGSYRIPGVSQSEIVLYAAPF